MRAIFGVSFAEIDHTQITALVSSAVREDADLDFKATLYGKSDKDRFELCKDIAAMRNHRGGVIVLGVVDKDGVAVAVPGVQLSDAEERRMRQIVASGTAPHAAFDIQRIEGDTEGSGFYLLIAQPSPLRPHGVIAGDSFRYPRRDGTTTRFMSEVEIADMYRSRFYAQTDQAGRLERIADEAMVQTGPPGPWLAMSLVPNSPGALPMSFAEKALTEEWAQENHCSSDPISGFFSSAVLAGVSVERYTLKPVIDHSGPASWAYAECHIDGAAATALAFSTPVVQEDRVVMYTTYLVWAVIQSLRFLGRHAERAGGYGDAAIYAKLTMADKKMVLGFYRDGLSDVYRDSRMVTAAFSRHTVPLQALTQDVQDLLIATRLVLNDLLNAFGQAESKHITPSGALRVRAFNDPQLAELAGSWNVETTLEQLPD